MQLFKKLREKTLYIAVGVCLWLAIGNWIEYKLPIESYRIVHASVKNATASRYNCSVKWNRQRFCEQTLIDLYSYKATFEIADREGWGAYIPNLQRGDTVYLVTRYWYQYPLTFGNPYSVYHLESNQGHVYYSIGAIKATNRAYAFFSGIMFAVCLLFLFIDLQVQKDKKRKQPVVAQVYEDKVTWE